MLNRLEPPQSGFNSRLTIGGVNCMLRAARPANLSFPPSPKGRI
jgi:hypothetical protein